MVTIASVMCTRVSSFLCRGGERSRKGLEEGEERSRGDSASTSWLEERIMSTGRRRRRTTCCQGTRELFRFSLLDDGVSVVTQSAGSTEKGTVHEAHVDWNEEQAQMARMGLPMSFGKQEMSKNAMHDWKLECTRAVSARPESTGFHDMNANGMSGNVHIRFDQGDTDDIVHRRRMASESPKERRRLMAIDTFDCCDSSARDQYDGGEIAAPADSYDADGGGNIDISNDEKSNEDGGGQRDGRGRVLRKYWLQRYSLFSLYDHGILMDEEGWYSATPEIIAWHHASMIVRAHGPGCIVLDAFGGVGGNAIQLALAGCHVLVTEICPQRASLIQHNARVYGVENDVEIICGDFTTCGPALVGVDVVLLSPPWGGPEYSRDTTFDVEHMGGNSHLSFGILLDIVLLRMKSSSALFWLPRHSDQEQLGVQTLKTLQPKTLHECHIELSKINGRQKAITVYTGTMGRFVSKFNDVS